MIYEASFLDGIELLQGLGLAGLLSNLHDIVLAFPIIFLAVGLVYCFFGRKIFDIVNFLTGGLIALGFVVSLASLSGIEMVLISIIAFLAGGLIGFFAPYLFVGIVGFSIGVGLLVSFSPLLGLLSGIVLAVAAILLFRFFLPFLTALVGGSLAAYAIFAWTNSEMISIIVGIVLIVIGTIFQYTYLEPHEREENKKRQSNDKTSEKSQ